MITLRRRQTASGNWLYQVLPEDHSAILPEPPWRPSEDFGIAIKAALAGAFLLGDGADEVEITQQDLDRYFWSTKISPAPLSKKIESL